MLAISGAVWAAVADTLEYQLANSETKVELVSNAARVPLFDCRVFSKSETAVA